MTIRKAPETMTAHERVRRTFAHEPTDRVTIGYECGEAAEARLMSALGVSDDIALKKALGVDYVWLDAHYTKPPIYPEIPNRTRRGDTGAIMRWVENRYGGYHDYCDFPLLDVDDETIANYPFPDPDGYDYEQSAERTDWLIDQGFSVHVGNPGFGDILNNTGMLMSVEESLVRAATGDEAFLMLVDHMINAVLGKCERLLERNKGKITFFWMGEDLGCQHTPLISHATYDAVLRPHHQRFIDLAHAYDLPIMMHSCGSSSWVYEKLISMGMDGVDTLQPEATNMSPAYLAEHFGGRLAFRGCISTAGPLAYGTPAEVTEICQQTLATLMPHKGYHFAPTHSIQDNTPAENIIAMYQAAHDFGRY